MNVRLRSRRAPLAIARGADPDGACRRRRVRLSLAESGLPGAVLRGHDGRDRDRPLRHGDPVRPGGHHVARLRRAYGFWRLYRGDPVARFRDEHVGGDALLGARRRPSRGAVRPAFAAHQRAPFRHHDLCHVRASAHRCSSTGASSPAPRPGSTCRRSGRCSASSWTSCRTPTCLSQRSCSSACSPPIASRNSRYGRTLRSIRENEQLARSIGVNTNMHKVRRLHAERTVRRRRRRPAGL